MADKEYFEWLGDDDAPKLPFINRVLADVEFNGPNHIGQTGDKDKISYFSDSKFFKKSTKTAFELNGGLSAEDVIESEIVATQGNSTGTGTATITGNASSTG